MAIFEKIFDQSYSGPAELFFTLWKFASELTTFQRTSATKSKLVREKFLVLLSNVSEPDVCVAVVDELKKYSTHLVQDKNGAVLELMRSIDECVALVHPRIGATSSALKNPYSAWLEDLLDAYAVKGVFYVQEHEALTFRGPLKKGPRPLFSSAADDLVDYFVAVTVVPRNLKNSTRNIIISQKFIPDGGFTGTTKASPSQERIAIVPFAKVPSDIKVDYFVVNNQGYVNFSISSNLQIVDVMQKVIDEFKNLDFLLLPELVICENDAEKISDFLVSAGKHKPSLTIAGSGDTNEVNVDGQRYNETQVFNALGKSLWRQKKVWTSGFTYERAVEYGLKPHAPGFILENNAESDEILVVDIQAYGRCIILICQDIETKPLAQELIHRYQPDWVFVPIMDSGIQVGRWAHSKIFDLSAVSNGRFVVASSLSLAGMTKANLTCGMAIGPKSPSVDHWDEARQCSFATLKDLDADAALIQWHHGDWKITELGSK